jgi:hypothetical protein
MRAGIIIFAGSPLNLSDIILGKNDDLLNQLSQFLQKIALNQISSLLAKFNEITNLIRDFAPPSYDR